MKDLRNFSKEELDKWEHVYKDSILATMKISSEAFLIDENNNVNCTNCINCSGCYFCENCTNCTDCSFCSNSKMCVGCHDCFKCKKCYMCYFCRKGYALKNYIDFDNKIL